MVEKAQKAPSEDQVVKNYALIGRYSELSDDVKAELLEYLATEATDTLFASLGIANLNFVDTSHAIDIANHQLSLNIAALESNCSVAIHEIFAMLKNLDSLVKRERPIVVIDNSFSLTPQFGFILEWLTQNFDEVTWRYTSIGLTSEVLGDVMDVLKAGSSVFINAATTTDSAELKKKLEELLRAQAANDTVPKPKFADDAAEVDILRKLDMLFARPKALTSDESDQVEISEEMQNLVVSLDIAGIDVDERFFDDSICDQDKVHDLLKAVQEDDSRTTLISLKIERIGSSGEDRPVIAEQEGVTALYLPRAYTGGLYSGHLLPQCKRILRSPIPLQIEYFKFNLNGGECMDWILMNASALRAKCKGIRLRSSGEFNSFHGIIDVNVYHQHTRGELARQLDRILANMSELPEDQRVPAPDQEQPPAAATPVSPPSGVSQEQPSTTASIPFEAERKVEIVQKISHARNIALATAAAEQVLKGAEFSLEQVNREATRFNIVNRSRELIGVSFTIVKDLRTEELLVKEMKWNGSGYDKGRIFKATDLEQSE